MIEVGTIQHIAMDITPDLPHLNTLNLFTNEMVSVYLDKHSRMSINTNDSFV